MMIHDITALAGKHKAKKRVGRGEGSGHGKQSGRGNKGAKSRSGYAGKRTFEGGQMPYFRRLAKFGFTNAPFRTQFWIVNLADVVSHPMFSKGGEVTSERLVEAGLVRDDSRDVKLLGDVGEEGLRVKLQVKLPRVSAKARKLVEGAGGSVTESGTRRDVVRGVDRNSEDKSPKNLTKKLKRGKKGEKPAAKKAEAAPADAKGDDKKA
ncbi:MAG: 50S ribosomal protein L15 [Planctomycetota bacterium]|nr:50S ribosomal protein L15 [Planctomycetota bacterium]